MVHSGSGVAGEDGGGVVVGTSDGEVVMEVEVGWRRMCATISLALGFRTMMEGGGGKVSMW
ncbi:hypothetical protein Hanom_Chr12g01097271 [Helianthus anomalus]